MNSNDRQNVMIVLGVLCIGFACLATIALVPGIPDKTRDALTQLLTLIVGGLLGFLSRGKQGNNDEPNGVKNG